MDQAFRKRLNLLLLLLSALVVVWIGLEIYHSTTFHLVSSDPATSNVATITPSIKLSFNHDIAPGSVVLGSNPSIIMGSQVSGKTLTVDLNTPTDTGKTYTLTIADIRDTKGKKLTNLRLQFSPTDQSYNSLPPSQQRAIQKQQASAPSRRAPVYTGTDTLLSNGLSPQQVEDFEQDIQAYTTNNAINLQSTVINQSSVTPAPLNGSGVFSITFSLSINNKPYSAVINYSGIQNIQLVLTNAVNGQQVFTGGSAT